MEIKALKNKALPLIKKYRFVLLLLLIGIVLMSLPELTNDAKSQKETVTVKEEKISVTEELSKILSSIEGVGKVRVLLTEKQGEQTVYQTNDNTTSSDTSQSVQSSTVTVTDAQHAQAGLIRQINPPTYQGAVIVCQGADSPGVRLSVIDAVSKLTGLKSDRISVLKMK